MAMYKTRNSGTENKILGMRGMLCPGNVAKHFREENVIKHSGECAQTFRRMSPKIPGNVPEHSGESKFRFIS